MNVLVDQLRRLTEGVLNPSDVELQSWIGARPIDGVWLAAPTPRPGVVLVALSTDPSLPLDDPDTARLALCVDLRRRLVKQLPTRSPTIGEDHG